MVSRSKLKPNPLSSTSTNVPVCFWKARGTTPRSPSYRFFRTSRLRYVKTDDELAWALPADGIVLGKSYKIKWRIRLGRGVASGTQLPLTVSVADRMEDEVVSAK